jgi:hypothetical protein
MTNKKIDLGEYIIEIKYNQENGRLDIDVYDELGEIIESMNIVNDEDADEDDADNIGFSLN